MSLDEREAVQYEAYQQTQYTAGSSVFNDSRADAPAPANGARTNGGRHARHAARDPEPPVPFGPAVPFGPPPGQQWPAADYAAGTEYGTPDSYDPDSFLSEEFSEFGGGYGATATLLQAPPRRSLEREHRRKRRRRWLLLILVLLVIAVVGAAGLIGYRSLQKAPIPDWTGSGTGNIDIAVQQNDGAAAIGATLVKHDVVASTKAFTRAAAKNPKAASIQAGVYQMHLHMSGVAALDQLLNPKAHLVEKLLITEGTTEKDLITALAAKLGAPVSAVTAAANNIASLGLPDGYAPAQGPLVSAEGFLFPDTYTFDKGETPEAALQTMASEFTSEDRSIGFAAGAAALKLTPYQALIIASMAQAEAKYVTDVPKVVRVILNRLSQNIPLKIDATSIYGAKLQNLDPTKIKYDQLDSPYNTYLHTGLPPTPIGNPGQDWMQATVTNPVAGDWLYYVNGAADGHLAFFNTAAEFEVGRQKCVAQHWGCG